MASCPVDLGEIIAAVEPLLHVIDLDAIIDAVEPLVVVIDLTAIMDAVPEPRRTHDRRGTALAQRMRDCKVIKSLQKPRGKFADHTAAQIDCYHNRFAKTARDIIDVASVKKVKIKGKGRYKRWLPMAALRCAFGSVRESSPRRANWLATSTRTSADVFDVSHTHVQRIRDACAIAVTSIQRERMLALPLASFASLVISFDETTVEMRVGGVQALHPLMMMHGRVQWIEAVSGHKTASEILMAPAALVTTKAPGLLAAINCRLPVGLSEILKRCRTLCLILVSDSARSCIRVARSLRGCTRLDDGMDGVACIWSPCLMHRVALVVFGTLKVFQSDGAFILWLGLDAPNTSISGLPQDGPPSRGPRVQAIVSGAGACGLKLQVFESIVQSYANSGG